MRRVVRCVVPLVACVVAVAACRDGARDAEVARSARAAGRAAFDPAAWRPPADSTIPNDSLGASIRRGRAILLHTPDSLPGYAPGRIACTNCHLDAGRNPASAPLTGSYARFPKYLTRSGAVIGMADRVNYCFTRSLAGSRLAHESREMQDILAYIAWLSQGVPVGAGGTLPGADGLPAMPALTGDSTRGAAVYVAKCQLCHGPDGGGNPGIPALWGPRSYSIGASMARQSKAASFIWNNMPLGQGRTLTPQEAYDVAAFVNAKPRPDSPGKEGDWPGGGAPADVPYATTGHVAYLPPPLLPRRNPEGALVPVPPAVSRRP